MIDDTRALWAETLPEESDGFMNYYYSVKTRDNWIQRDEADGQLVSMIHWNPYRMHVKGQVWDTRYVIAVATKKEYRRQGRMARLLTEGMRKYAAEGVPFVWLMPIDRAIYEPFDFRYVYEKYETSTSQGFDVKEMQEDQTLKVKILSQDEYEEAADFLNCELAKRYDVFTWRTREWLEDVEAEVASEDGHIWGIFDEEGLAGVFHEWRGETIEIRELVCEEKYEEGTCRTSLISAVSEALHKDDISLIREMNHKEKNAPIDSPVKHRPITAITTGWLGTPKPIIMARIINVKEFVKVIKAKRPVSLIIQITDELIPDNQGIFHWTLTESGSLMERMENRNPNAGKDGERIAIPKLTLAIAELTEWLFGRRQMPGYEDICTLEGIFLNEIV